MLPVSSNPQPQQPVEQQQPHLGTLAKQHPLQTASAIAGGFLSPFQGMADPSQPQSLKNMFTDLSYMVPGIGDVQAVRYATSNWKGSDLLEKALMVFGLIGAVKGVSMIKNSALHSRFVPEDPAMSTFGSAYGEPERAVLPQMESFPQGNVEAARRAPGGLIEPTAWEQSKNQFVSMQHTPSQKFAASAKSAENFQALAWAVHRELFPYITDPYGHLAANSHVAGELAGWGRTLVERAKAAGVDVGGVYYGTDVEQQLNAAKSALVRLKGLVDDGAFGDHNGKVKQELEMWAYGDGEVDRSTDDIIATIAINAEEFMRDHRIGPDNVTEPGTTVHFNMSDTSFMPEGVVGYQFLPDGRIQSSVSGTVGNTKLFHERDRSINPRSLAPEIANNALLQLQVSLGLMNTADAANAAVFYPKMNALLKELNQATNDQYDIPTLSAAVTVLSAQTHWLPDNVLAGIHVVLQAGRPDLTPGSEQYVNAVKDILRKSGWGDDMHIDSPDFKQRLLSDARYLGGQVTDSGGIATMHGNVKKAWDALSGETPEMERLLTLKYMTFAWLGVNPTDPMLAVMDSLTAAFGRGMRLGQGTKWAEFMVHKTTKGGETWMNPVTGESQFTPEKKNIPHELAFRAWEADQEGFRLAAKWIQDHPDTPLGRKMAEIMSHPQFQKFGADINEVTPSIVQALAWKDWSDNSQVAGARQILSDSYLRTLQGNHQVNKGALDAVRAAPSDLAPPPGVITSSKNLETVRGADYRPVIMEDQAGHVFLDTDSALNVFNGTHLAHIGINGVHQIVHNAPTLVDKLGDVADQMGGSTEVRTRMLNPNEPMFDQYTMDSQVITAEVRTPEDAQAVVAALDSIPAKIAQTHVATGPMEAAHTMLDLSQHEHFTGTQMQNLFDTTDWAAISPHISSWDGMYAAINKLREMGVEGIPDEKTVLEMSTGQMYRLLHGEPKAPWVEAFQQYEADAYDRLHQALVDAGGQPGPAIGQYEGAAEDSVFAFGVPVEDAVRIARAFHQESVATHAGLFFSMGDNQGKMIPATGSVQIGEHLLTPDAAGNIPDHTLATLPNGQKVAFVAQYDGWEDAPKDLSVYSSRQIESGSPRIQIHVDLGFKPAYEHVDRAYQILDRHDSVVSTQAHVSTELFRPPGTVPVYDRRFVNSDGSQVMSRSRSQTGNTNEWTVYVSPEEAAKVPDTLPSRTVAKLSSHALMYDNHVAVLFPGDGVPDKVPRNPLSSKGIRWAIVELGDQPVIHLLDEAPEGLNPGKGKVIVRAYRGTVDRINTAENPADYENAMNVFDGLGIKVNDSVMNHMKGDLATWAQASERVKENMAVSTAHMNEYKPKKYHGYKIPSVQTPIDETITTRTGLKAYFDGNITEEQGAQIADMFDAWINGRTSESVPAEMRQFFDTHPGLGKEVVKLMGGKVGSTVFEKNPYASGMTMNATVPSGDAAMLISAGYLEGESIPGFHERIRAAHTGWKPDTGLTLIQETVVHEMGHVLEHILRKKGLGAALTRRVEAAYQELGGTAAELRQKLSGYATQNDQEFLAEAVLAAIASPNPHPAVVSLVDDLWSAATGFVDKKNLWR